jgi:SAM-dependent methyltransferase
LKLQSSLSPSFCKLFGYSFLILFFELALIRFIPSNVRITAYFINLVLVAAFLGMGIGMLRVKKEQNLTKFFPPLLLILTGVCVYFSNILVVAPSTEEAIYAIYYDLSPNSREWGMVPVVSVIFIFSTLPFISLGNAMGREFKNFPALHAYAINTAGSLAGLLSFSLLSHFSTPPIVWFVLGGLLFLFLAGKQQSFIVSILCMGMTFYLVQNLYQKDHEIWSPYYKINYYQKSALTSINVNGSLHQYMLNFSPPKETQKPYADKIKQDYQLPYRFAKSWDDVLVLGAGSGNDVHLVLEQGAENVDAVEIDRAIWKLGKDLNYQKPYDDPRVHVHIDDARAFLKKSKKKYDVIILGTLDSQTLLSGMSSIRLDNYVYTMESLQSVQKHLKQDGVVIIYHSSLNISIPLKLAKILTDIFGIHPLIQFEKEHRLFNYTFVAGSNTEAVNDFGYFFPALKNNDQITEDLISPPTDDWPYLYLDEPGIPKHYLQAGGLILLLSLISIIFSAGRKNLKNPDWTLFLFGASFLLLETKSVTEMSLLFGSTWQVNVLVFAAILSLIFVANIFILLKGPFDKTKLFVGLFISIMISYATPTHSLLALPLAGQWIAGTLITAVPLFFAGMLFSQIFQNRLEPVTSLGFNLMGAICGGLLEYSSMALGTKNLYLLALVLYILAFLAHGREKGTQ